MPKYSIIVPVYNAEKVLCKCVDSILAQDYRDYEVLLIDDCSQDSSLKLCEQYATENSNVSVFQQNTNKGVSAARNMGIAEASGKYILFVDSDDFVATDYLLKIEKCMLDFDCDLITFGNFDYIVSGDTEALVRKSEFNYYVNGQELDGSKWEKLFLKTFFAAPWNKVYRASIIKENNLCFDETCVCYEDYLFNVEYCNFVKNFVSIDSPLYYYRQIVQDSHVAKRKWGNRFEISRKVALATEAFILGHDVGQLQNLWRYPYRAYLIELQSVKLTDKKNFKDAVTEMLADKNFEKVVCSVKPAGKWLTLLKLLMRFKVYSLAILLLKTKVGRVI